MTHKQNITAILECYFAGFKEEINREQVLKFLNGEVEKMYFDEYADTKYYF